MLFKIADTAQAFKQDLDLFVEICGAKRLKKRLRYLRSELDASLFKATITLDYHWLELCLINLIREEPKFDELYLDDMCAVKLVSMCARVHQRLSPGGQKTLKGRIIDCLKSDNGFAPIYLEMDAALRMMHYGFNVDFTDFEDTEQFDLLVHKGKFEIEVECKSQSADAGRKIHRKDFYRFAERLKPLLDTIISSQYLEIIVTFNERFPTSNGEKDELRDRIKNMYESGRTKYQSDNYSIVIENVSLQLHDFQDWEARSKRKYGQNIHMTGAIGERGAGFLIVRSEKEDDTSKPVLQALKKAYSQFTGSRPCLVSLQYNDILPIHLAQDNVRRRDGILANYMFHCGEYDNLGAILVGCYKNAVSDLVSIEAAPAYGMVNPNPTHPIPKIFHDALGSANKFEHFLKAVMQPSP